MAAAALRTRSTGAAAGLMDTGAATVVMVDLLSRSALRCARNSGLGKPPSRRSMSRCEYLGIGGASLQRHPGPQLVQCAQLQLLDRALAPADARGDVADAALVDEALDDHGALIGRKLADEPEQTRALFRALDLEIRGGGPAGGLAAPRLRALARRALRAIDGSACGGFNQPRAPHRAPPPTFLPAAERPFV